MRDLAMTAYILIWPVMAAAVLAVLSVSVARDMRKAARKGESLV